MDPEIATTLYRINDFSKKIGLGRTKIYQMIKEGELRPVRIGGRTLIPASEILRLMGKGPNDE